MKKVNTNFTKGFLSICSNKAMIWLISFVFLSNSVLCQPILCGTQPSSLDDEAYKQAIMAMHKSGENSNRSDVNITVRPVIFTDYRNYSNVSKNQLEAAMVKLSNRYEKFGINIVVCDPIYLRNNVLYDLDLAYETAYLDRYSGESVINFYVVNTLKYNKYEICGVGLFPFGNNKRFIAVGSKCIDQDFTIPHEFGHALGLYHTHEKSMGEELVLRTNCTFAGDMLCDTPADPTLGFHNVDSLCHYFGKEKDKNERSYTPNPANLMSYAPDQCVNIFSQEQISLMKYNAEKYYNKYFTDCNFNDISIASDFEFGKSVLSGYDFSFPYEVYTNSSIELFDYKVAVSVIDPDGDDITISEVTYSTDESIEDQILKLSLPSHLESKGYVLQLRLVLPDGIKDLNYLDNSLYFPFMIDYGKLGQKRIFYDIQNGVIQVYFKSVDEGVISIEIYDASGKNLTKFTEKKLQSGSYVNAINADNMSSGVYFVKVSTPKETFTTRLAVIH